MAELQARIGPKATKLYPNLTWKRPGADLQSPKNSMKRNKTHPSHENEYDSDASSREHASSQTLSPNKSRSDHQSSPSRPRQSSGPPSLLRRMGLNSGVSEDGSSEGEEAASIQQSLLARVEEETPTSSPIIGSTWRDNGHVLASNVYHDIANSNAQRLSPQPPSSNGQSNAFIIENQSVDNRHNGSSHDNPNNGQTKRNDGLVVKPSAQEASSPRSLHKPILHNSSKFNHSPTNTEISQNLSEEGIVAEKIITPRNLEFEDGELVDTELPSQKVRDLLLPLVLENAAHREKEGESDLSRHTAHCVLSDEVCASFVDQMKEVRTEMHAHKNRSLHNPPQVQPTTGEVNNSEGTHTSSSKIGQAPPLGPRAMRYPINTSKYKPPNGEIVTKSNFSKDLAQPTSTASSHSHDPVSSSVKRRRESGFRHTPSPEHRDVHEYDRDHDPRFDNHRSRSRSHSPGRPSRGQLYYKSSDQSRRMARSRSPVTLASSPPPSPLHHRRRSPPRVFFRDRVVRKSPEEIPGRRSGSPLGSSSQDRMPECRQSPLRDFRRTDGNISPRWDTADSSQSPFYPSSRKHSGRRGADKVMSPRRPSFTHDRGAELDDSPKYRRDGHVSKAHSGSEFARRSASPPRKHRRQFSAEQPLPRTPPLYSPPRPETPNPYYQSPRKSEALLEKGYRERSEQSSYDMRSLSPVVGSTLSHLVDNAAGSRHQVTKLMAINSQDVDGRVNEEVGMRLPKKTDDMQRSELSVLPCHNVPGVWFAKVALDDIGTLECSFEVDEVTALKWNLQHTKEHILQKEDLRLQICCLSQNLMQSLMQSLKPDATAQDVASAMVTIENDWPTPGHLIIVVNPQDKNKRIWLPDKLEPSCLPVCIEDCVVEGQNIVQFIQLSGMSDRMFVLFATTGPLLGLQHDEFVPAPLQNSIDGGDTCEIGFEEAIVSSLR